MHAFHRAATIVTAVLSATFALLLYVTIVEDYGAVLSVGIILLGVAVIWAAYFGLGALFGYMHEQGRREGRDDNSDFV